MGLPTLVVVSGPPGGYGKTTLAHTIARTVGCPAICRDEIKEGMVHANPGFDPRPGDLLTQRAFRTFFDTLELLLRAGATVVAEAAFQGRVWGPDLERLSGLTGFRIIQCTVPDTDLARARNARRYAANPVRKAAHSAPNNRGSYGAFSPISLAAPTLLVDTSDGYKPRLEDILDFVNQR